jgi:hypothetical protein
MDKPADFIYKDKRYGQYRELFYNYDNTGQFEKTVGFHGETDRVSLQQAWDLFHDRIEEARVKVLEGKASPIVYYMEKILADPLNLSMMAGISLWRVKRHFKPRVFNRLSEKTLRKYAEAFNVSIEELKNVK